MSDVEISRRQAAENRTEELLRALDDIAAGIKKVRREIHITASWGAPTGYLCCSLECTNTVGRCKMSALELADRIVYLKHKEKELSEWMIGLRQVMSQMERPVGRALYFRYQRDLSALECAEALHCSVRTFFRLRHIGLTAVRHYMERTELGKRILSDGAGCAVHRYFK